MKKGDARRRYAPEFKQDALELAERIGVSNTARKIEHFSELSAKMEMSEKHSY